MEQHVPLDEPLHTPLTLERQQRQTEREIPPLTRVFGEPEPLAQLFDNRLGLLVLLMSIYFYVYSFVIRSGAD